MEAVAARREHADALAVRQLRQADGALRVAPPAGQLNARPCPGLHGEFGGRGVGRRLRRLWLPLRLRPRTRGAAAGEAAEEEAGGGGEGEGEEGDAGEDDEDGGHVGEECPGAGVGAPGVTGGVGQRPRWRRRRGDHGRRRGVHGGRGGVVGPACHGLDLWRVLSDGLEWESDSE